MKLTVIGGGGVRSLFLAASVACRATELNITELSLTDIDELKLSVYGNLAKQAAGKINSGLKVMLYSDAEAALSNADYVITTIRAGGDEMRVNDERVALSLRLLGQETTGAAGLSFAMRSVPALIGYLETIKRVSAPGVKVFNFTNPAGLVSEILTRLGYDFTYGICDAPSGMLKQFADYYGCPVKDAKAEVYGLNHLSFFKSVKLSGKDVTQELIGDEGAYKATDLRYFNKEFVKELGVIPNEYLYYYFSREIAVNNILNAKFSRGELIRDVNRKMTEELLSDGNGDYGKSLRIFEKWYGVREDMYMAEETGISRRTKFKFEPHNSNSGYAAVALKFIELAETGKQDEMILCTKNNGALDFLDDSDIVEVTADIIDGKPCVHRFTDVSPFTAEIIRRMKYYERKAAEALIDKSISALKEALYFNPFVNSVSLAEKLASEYIDLNKNFIGGWK